MCILILILIRFEIKGNIFRFIYILQSFIRFYFKGNKF